MATDITRKSWVQKTPNVCGGDACIRQDANHRTWPRALSATRLFRSAAFGNDPGADPGRSRRSLGLLCRQSGGNRGSHSSKRGSLGIMAGLYADFGQPHKQGDKPLFNMPRWRLFSVEGKTSRNAFETALRMVPYLVLSRYGSVAARGLRETAMLVVTRIPTHRNDGS